LGRDFGGVTAKKRQGGVKKERTCAKTGIQTDRRKDGGSGNKKKSTYSKACLGQEDEGLIRSASNVRGSTSTAKKRLGSLGEIDTVWCF